MFFLFLFVFSCDKKSDCSSDGANDEIPDNIKGRFRRDERKFDDAVDEIFK